MEISLLINSFHFACQVFLINKFVSVKKTTWRTTQPQDLCLKIFQRKTVAQILIFVWNTPKEHLNTCQSCKIYKYWCIKALKTKWQTYYVDLETLICRLSEKEENLKKYLIHKIELLYDPTILQHTYQKIINNSDLFKDEEKIEKIKKSYYELYNKHIRQNI